MHMQTIFFDKRSLKGVIWSALKTFFSKYLENGTMYIISEHLLNKCVWNDKKLSFDIMKGLTPKIRAIIKSLKFLFSYLLHFIQNSLWPFEWSRLRTHFQIMFGCRILKSMFYFTFRRKTPPPPLLLASRSCLVLFIFFLTCFVQKTSRRWLNHFSSNFQEWCFYHLKFVPAFHFVKGSLPVRRFWIFGWPSCLRIS